MARDRLGSEQQFPHPRWWRLLARGLVRHCPRCGGGRLFASWLKLLPRCPRCGMRFEREEGFFLGAYVVNFGVILIVLAAYIGVSVAVTLPHPPAGRLILGAAVVSVVVPIFFYPFSLTVWSAFDLWMTPLHDHEVEAARQARQG